MLVVYEGNGEVLVTTLDEERVLRKQYFDDADRDYDNYDRYVCNGVLEINPDITIRADQKVMADL